MKIKGWYLVLILAGCFMIAGGILYAVYTPDLWGKRGSSDTPEFSKDQVLNIVHREIELRPFLGDRTFRTSDYWGRYDGAGNWTGGATVIRTEQITFNLDNVTYPFYRIDWEFHEKSRTVEITDILKYMME
jgi:hypothetical protein